jgi:hypothetical protein
MKLGPSELLMHLIQRGMVDAEIRQVVANNQKLIKKIEAASAVIKASKKLLGWAELQKSPPENIILKPEQVKELWEALAFFDHRYKPLTEKVQ